MKKRMLSLLVALTTIITFVSAQPQNPQGDVDAVPIEGLGLLIAGGALFGIFKIIKYGKDSSHHPL